MLPYAARVADSARDIENLLYLYAERIDAGDFDGVADLFAHGRVLGQEDGPPETVFEGRDAVRRLYGMTTRRYDDTGTPKTKHLISNARIVVDDAAGTAWARTQYVVLQATEALALQPIVAGHYDDTFHRVDDAWWFDSRTMFVDLTGDLSQHLTF